MTVEEDNMKVAFPLCQTLQEVFHSVNSVEELKAVCSESDVSLSGDESSSGN